MATSYILLGIAVSIVIAVFSAVTVSTSTVRTVTVSVSIAVTSAVAIYHVCRKSHSTQVKQSDVRGTRFSFIFEEIDCINALMC